MISVNKMTLEHLRAVRALSVAEEQSKYVGNIEEILKCASKHVHSHVIRMGQQVIGFFLLDTQYPQNYDFCPANSLGLRAFFIDDNQQGKGYGKQASKQLKPYLSKHYSSYRSVYLTVNCQNPVAYSCYQNAGFLDTNEQYLGGLAGPQHVMKMELN